MLNYLEQGTILYAMAAVCVIGMIGRFVANHFYKSLIRQADNLAAAKDKQLQQMKTKYESIYRMNCGMRNTPVFVSKMQQQYRVGGVRLTSWDSASIYSGVTVFLAGALAALVLYINKANAQTCIMYLAGGSLMAAVMMAFSGVAGGTSNREMLENALVHYFENVLVVRGAAHDALEMPDVHDDEEDAGSGIRNAAFEREAVRSSAAARTRGNMRDDIFMHSEENSQPKGRDEKRTTAAARSSTVGTATALPKSDDAAQRGREKQLEELKESLAQIAAARGEAVEKQGLRQPGKLSPKEEQLINEIISQYLA